MRAGVSASGAIINLTSSNPSAAPVPATITMPANTAWTQFQMQAGQVVSPTPVTITASLNGGSASGQRPVQPPALQSVWVPSPLRGGTPAGTTSAHVDWVAKPAGNGHREVSHIPKRLRPQLAKIGRGSSV